MDCQQTQSGFTLIELLMVIIIASIMAVFSMPLWTNYSVNVAAEMDQIVTDLLYAQILSMNTGTRHQFIKTSANTYQIQTCSTGVAVILPGSASTTTTLANGVTFGAFTNLPNNLVCFSGLGAPYTDNLTPPTALTATASISLTAANTTSQTVSIAPYTGYLTES